MKQWLRALEQLCAPERPIWVPELRNDIELHIKAQSKSLQQQAETIERLIELMLVIREQTGLLQEAIIRCDRKEELESRAVLIIEMVNKQVTNINKLEEGGL